MPCAQRVPRARPRFEEKLLALHARLWQVPAPERLREAGRDVASRRQLSQVAMLQIEGEPREMPMLLGSVDGCCSSWTRGNGPAPSGTDFSRSFRRAVAVAQAPSAHQRVISGGVIMVGPGAVVVLEVVRLRGEGQSNAPF